MTEMGSQLKKAFFFFMRGTEKQFKSRFIRYLRMKFSIFPNKYSESYRYYQLGFEFEKSERWEEAADAYQFAVSLNDQKANWHYRLGFVLEKSSEWRQAAAVYQTAIKLNNEKANWHYRLGGVLEKINNTMEATKAYENALNMDPENPFYNYRFGLMVSKRPGQLSEAIKYLSRAVERRAEPSWIAELKQMKNYLDEGINFRSSKLKPSLWYDEVYEYSDEYHKNFDESNYWPVWSRIIEIINRMQIKRVLELGCGPGQLALAIRALTEIHDYIGIDFSAKAISMARDSVPEYHFIVGDILIHEIVKDPSFDLIICTEVLEHIDDDLFLLSRINQKTKILATVPNYDSAAHLRYFNEKGDVVRRYAKLIYNFEIEEIEIGKNTIFLIKGMIRGK